MRMYMSLAVAGLLCLAPVVALADTIPGGGGSDPTIDEGVVNTGFGTVFSGDVIICENGATCSLTPSAGWSDVLVFYDPANGPFVTDATQDATDAVMFSDDGTGFFSLSNFLANYNTGVGGANGLSSNALVGATEDASGNWNYAGAYSGNSPEAVPEPTSIALLGSVLVAVGFARRKFARR